MVATRDLTHENPRHHPPPYRPDRTFAHLCGSRAARRGTSAQDASAPRADRRLRLLVFHAVGVENRSGDRCVFLDRVDCSWITVAVVAVVRATAARGPDSRVTHPRRLSGLRIAS